MTEEMGFGSRAVRLFFMHLGGLVTAILYFTLYGASGHSPAGLRRALFVALAAQSGYIALAWSQDEHKQFDVGLWLMFAVGTLGILAGFQPLIALFQIYSPAILFVTLGLTAALPPLLGYESFTAYFARRTVPRWQRKLAITERIGHVIGAFWVLLFFIAAGLCAYAPLDWRFTGLYPNLLVFVVGMTANKWLPALYLRWFPLEMPTSVEPIIMGMPMAFDRKAAQGVRAQIQFRISGTQPGNYWLRIANGRCQSFEGDSPAPDLTVHALDTVWLRIVRGEIDGGEALAAGQYRFDGDGTMLAALSRWFPNRR